MGLPAEAALAEKNAKEIWLGHIRPGGSLESILKATPGQSPTNLP